MRACPFCLISYQLLSIVVPIMDEKIAFCLKKDLKNGKMMVDFCNGYKNTWQISLNNQIEGESKNGKVRVCSLRLRV